MNARTIRKRLMSRPNHRAAVLWGRRAYLTLSVPLSMYPEAPPLYVPPTLPRGHKASIHPVTSHRCDPEEHAVDPQPNRWGEGWEWYEGQILIDHGDGGLYGDGGRLPADVVLAYARRDRWVRKWLHGEDVPEEYRDGLIGDLLRCSDWPKSVHATIVGDRAVMQYGVKWFYASCKLRFCRDVARFLDAARRAGVDARVWR